jgi:hypothetical protein
MNSLIGRRGRFLGDDAGETRRGRQDRAHRSRTIHAVTRRPPAHAGLRVVSAEPISPELVLVSPELRTVAIEALWDVDGSSLGFDGSAHAGTPPAPGMDVLRCGSTARLLSRLLLYAAWEALIVALFGLATFAAVVVLTMGIALAAR